MQAVAYKHVWRQKISVLNGGRILLAGESWSSSTAHSKGFDHFWAADFQTGIGPLRKALAGSEIAIMRERNRKLGAKPSALLLSASRAATARTTFRWP